MSPEKQRIAIAKSCGWRIWQIGDPLIKRQLFADTKFGGHVRRVERVYGPRGATLDVDESPLYSIDLFGKGREYEPLNGWLSPNGVWKLYPPDYFHNLGAIHEAMEFIIRGPDIYEFRSNETLLNDEIEKIAEDGQIPVWRLEAKDYCEALLKFLGKWEEGT